MEIIISDFEDEIAKCVSQATSLGIRGLSIKKPYKLAEELLISTHIYFCADNIPRLKNCEKLKWNGKTYSSIFDEILDVKRDYDFTTRVVKSSISTVLDLDLKSNKPNHLINLIDDCIYWRHEDESEENLIYFINDDLITRTMDDFFSTLIFENNSLPLSSFDKKFGLTMKNCQELIDHIGIKNIKSWRNDVDE